MAGLALFALLGMAAADEMELNFKTPPATARPWVYWFWLNGNLTKEGMTADLEAMQRAGIGGVLIIIEIRVVNLPINRMLGDELLPEDSDRDGEGKLKQWPQWVQEGKPSPSGRYTFTSWRLWKKGEPLQESGLLGPVTIRTGARIR